jgi:hypothetical protein
MSVSLTFFARSGEKVDQRSVVWMSQNRQCIYVNAARRVDSPERCFARSPSLLQAKKRVGKNNIAKKIPPDLHRGGLNI